MRPGIGVLFLAAVLAFPTTASAALTRAFVAGGFNNPVQVTGPRSAPSGTLYIVEQPGRIIRWRNGNRNVVLDIRGRVRCCGEEGLLSLAFSPNFGVNRGFYVYFTNNSGNQEAEAYKMNSSGTRAVAGSKRDLLTILHPGQSNHNGGTLAFGPDNVLYLSTGDGGSGCDPPENAQNLSSRLGKLLRLDGTRALIYGYGLRNPYRMSFDRLTGDLYIGDVGQSTREEVDFLPRGQLPRPAENYEWDDIEGTVADTCENEGLKGSGPRKGPIHEYGRSSGFTVIGGFVYRGGAIPEAEGRYFFGDLGGDVWSFVESGGARTGFREEPFDISNLVSFGEGPRGGLYLVSHDGNIYQLRAA